MSDLEVGQAIDGLMTAFKEFKAGHDLRLSALEQHIARQNRRDVLGAAGDGNGDLGRERAALGRFCKLGDDTELKGMEVAVGPEGGYLVLPAVSDVMVRRLWDSSPIRRLARIQTMTSGDSWVEPIDRNESAASWVAETQARPALETPELGLLTVPLDEIYSNQVVTQKLLDLSYVDIGAWLEAKIADKFARSEASAFLSGTGVGQPKGILSYSIVSTADATRPNNELQYIAGGVADALNADSLRACYWGLRGPYRATSSWLMNSSTAAAIDKLKLGDGSYVWTCPGFVEG
jgi:HK97 family phage major capsid protein